MSRLPVHFITTQAHMKFFLIILFIFSLNCTDSFAQDYLSNFSTYSVQDGLSGRIVNGFFEDSNGFMWIYTSKGINRFDGQDFKVFLRKDKANHTSSCRGLAEDIDGNIWPKFVDKDTEPIYHFLIDKYLNLQKIDTVFANKMPFKASDIYDIHQTENNILYILTKDEALYRYDGEFTHLITHPYFKYANIATEYQSDSIHLVSPQGIFSLDSLADMAPPILFPISKNKGYSRGLIILEDEAIVLPYFKRGIYKGILFPEAPEPKIKEKVSLPPLFYTLPNHSSIHQQQIDGKIFYLVRATNFLLLLDHEFHLIYDFSSDLKEQFGDMRIEFSLFLRENQIWFSNGNGFCIVHFQANQFHHFLNRKLLSATRGFTQLTDGKILSMSYAGLTTIHPTTQQIDSLEIVTFNSKQLSIKVIPSSRTAIEQEDGRILLDCNTNHIFSYDRKTKNLQYIVLTEKAREKINHAGFHGLFKDSKGKVWVGSQRGLIQYNSGLDSLEVFEQYNEFLDLKNEITRYFYEEKDSIWIATTNGLFVLDSECGIQARYQPLPHLNVLHFYREGEVFWLATGSHGLVKWDRQTDEVQQYNTETGMLDDFIMAVYPDTMGNLWLTSEMGLIKFKKSTGHIRTFLEANGITHNEFNLTSHFQDENGRLYFGGLNGINVFHPAEMKNRNKTETPFRVIKYQELDEEYGDFFDKTNTYIENEKIVITPEVTAFKIHFTLLNYQKSHQTLYLYQLEGLDKTYTFQKENYIRFNQLPYGKYTLKIKAQDYAGEEAEGNLSIPIEVLAPFYYQRQWQALGVFLIALLIYSYIKWRVYSIELDRRNLEDLVHQRTATIESQNQQLLQLNQLQESQKQELKQINQTKDRLFAILAHDLRSPLHSFKSLSNHVHYLLQNNDKNRLNTLVKYLEKEAGQLSHLLDNLLHWALAQRGELSIEPEVLELDKVIENVLVYHRPLASRLGVELLNEVAKKTLLKADKRVLETVFRNLVSNALRYTSKDTGRIKIAAFYSSSTIRIKVSDNGQGMRPEKLNTLFNLTTTKTNISLGLHLCKEMITLLGGNISAESQVNKGTTFIVTLPNKRLLKIEQLVDY